MSQDTECYRIDSIEQAAQIIGALIEELSTASDTSRTIQQLIVLDEIGKATELAAVMSTGITAHVSQILAEHSTAIAENETAELTTYNCISGQIGNC